MDNLFWAIVIGFGVMTVMLYALMEEVKTMQRIMQNDVIDCLKDIKDNLAAIENELGRNGTLYELRANLAAIENELGRGLGRGGALYEELRDIEKAVQRPRYT